MLLTSSATHVISNARHASALGRK